MCLIVYTVAIYLILNKNSLDEKVQGQSEAASYMDDIYKWPKSLISGKVWKMLNEFTGHFTTVAGHLFVIFYVSWPSDFKANHGCDMLCKLLLLYSKLKYLLGLT